MVSTRPSPRHFFHGVSQLATLEHSSLRCGEPSHAERTEGTVNPEKRSERRRTEQPGRFDGRRNATHHAAASGGPPRGPPRRTEPIGSLRLRSSASLCTTVRSVTSVTSVNSRRAALLRPNENRSSRHACRCCHHIRARRRARAGARCWISHAAVRSTLWRSPERWPLSPSVPGAPRRSDRALLEKGSICSK